MTHQLGVEFCAVEREVDVEVDAVEGALRCVHTFEILLEVLAAQIRGESDNFLDACTILVSFLSQTMERSSLTRILGIFGTYVFVAGVQNVLVHERSTRCDLTEERNLDRLACLDTLTLLHKDLTSVLATILAVQAGDTVLLGVVTFLEGLEGGHKVMSTGDTRCDDALGDTSSDGTLDNGGDRVHGADNLGLELRRNVKFDLLEQVF